MAMARTSRMRGMIFLAITVCFLSFPACAEYSGGTGEPNATYQIASAEDLMLLGESPEDYDKHFILTADINLDPNLPGRKGFGGAVIAKFSGVFAGNNHTISHLTIKGGSHLGLFERLETGAEVRDVDSIIGIEPYQRLLWRSVYAKEAFLEPYKKCQLSTHK